MQARGDLVALVVELPAGVQGGHHHLEGGLLGLLVEVDGDAAAVVGDGDAAIDVQPDRDVLAEPGDGFVDGVCDHFLDQVMKAANVRVADVHSRALTNALYAGEDLDVCCVVGGFFCHEFPSNARGAGAPSPPILNFMSLTRTPLMSCSMPVSSSAFLNVASI